jgi:hypothetical protein
MVNVFQLCKLDMVRLTPDQTRKEFLAATVPSLKSRVKPTNLRSWKELFLN